MLLGLVAARIPPRSLTMQHIAIAAKETLIEEQMQRGLFSRSPVCCATLSSSKWKLRTQYGSSVKASTGNFKNFFSEESKPVIDVGIDVGEQEKWKADRLNSIPVKGGLARDPEKLALPRHKF